MTTKSLISHLYDEIWDLSPTPKKNKVLDIVTPIPPDFSPPPLSVFDDLLLHHVTLFEKMIQEFCLLQTYNVSTKLKEKIVYDVFLFGLPFNPLKPEQNLLEKER